MTLIPDITVGADIQVVGFLAPYFAAVSERVIAQGGSALTAPVAGDDIQNAFVINSLQSAIGSFSGWVDTDLFDPTTTLHPTDYHIEYTLATFCARTGLDPSGLFRRKRPRRVAYNALSSPFDSEGNAAVAGQRAWVFHPIGGEIGLSLYDGSAWITEPYTGTLPDILDSDLAPPNHIPYGNIQAGDYIGPWLFEEIRACVYAKTITLLTSVFGWQQQFKSGETNLWDGTGNPPKISKADALASALAEFNAASWATDPDYSGFAPYSGLGLSKSLWAPYGVGPPYDGFTYSASLVDQQSKIRIENVPNSIARTMKVFHKVYRYRHNEPDTADLIHYYNDGGSGWTDTFYEKVVDTAAATPYVSAYIGTGPISTTNEPPDPAGLGGALYEGWESAGAGLPEPLIGVAIWDFTYHE
jgi:hypothetical protein